MPTRREWLAITLSGLVTSRLSGAPLRRETITVHKQPGCGCCDKWAEHLRGLGFEVNVSEDAALDSYRDGLGVPRALRSCHTGTVGGYVAEGHVPGDLIRRMLDEKPQIAGLAVGGMPIGSPGMEMGERTDSYDVIAFRKDGTTFVYAKR